ncbi:hypothetical protein DRE_04099 [Drechslerella stenobrocha 248]|uniref:Metaxin glutathione S-transferase domain-containing protein n=1 Tax=Drechslerella stenobrocha 248 TaxID=1043628 RepID=W7I2J8_9PEZI|nr:hypothetical protein DRE_04099 [Drechslerella stenobrocha 248]
MPSDRPRRASTAAAVDPVPMAARDLRPVQSAAPATLFVFSAAGAEEEEQQEDDGGAPSFNPTYLKIRGVDFRTESSSNHASPTGSLPFLIDETPVEGGGSGGRQLPRTVPTNKLAQWIDETAASSVNTVDLDAADVRAFTSLLDTSIRDAWLYAMYVDPTNLHTITTPRYTHATPLWPVTAVIGAQMRNAALASIRQSHVQPTGRALYAAAAEAWDALSTLLDEEQWFFGARDAGVFDAGVFAYAHLMLASGGELAAVVNRHENLVAHEARVRRKWYPGSSL